MYFGAVSGSRRFGIVHGSCEIGRERRQLEVSANAHEQLVLKRVPQTR